MALGSDPLSRRSGPFWKVKSPRLAEIARLEQERKSINSELRKLRARPVQVGDWRQAR